MKDLGTLGGVYSYGNGINIKGQVVGEAQLADLYTTHAFLWKRSC
jgi:probable HAF family extracellular repeat protein